MVIKRNKSNRQYVISQKLRKMSAFMVTPFPKSRQGVGLTIKSGKSKITLNGRQVRNLRNLLSTAEKISYM